jgi:hypothetical protein
LKRKLRKKINEESIELDNEYDVVCGLCKKRIELRPSICVDIFEKEWWWEQDSKPYWRNKDSGRIYCNECFNQIFLETEYCGQET